MNSLHPDHPHPIEPSRQSLSRGRRLLLGPSLLMNQLLAAELEVLTGVSWDIIEGPLHFPPVLDTPSDGRCRRLLLWEARAGLADQVTDALSPSGPLDAEKDCVALFNLRRGTGIEQVCTWKGVRGFFYEDEGLETLKQGVLALLAGRVWIAPEVLAQPVQPRSQGFSPRLPAPWNLLLGRREQEVLELLVKGRSNQEVADELAISAHTVKTHIYKIFKKIGVSSRLEAAIWYMSHI